jgi:hypothetical protein
MLNKDKTPRQYRHIDPEKLDTSDIPPIGGTNADCLADSLLDIIQLALESGMTQPDVDEAMKRVTDTLADQERFRFRLHIRDEK